MVVWHFGHGRESSQSVYEAIQVSWDMGERHLFEKEKPRAFLDMGSISRLLFSSFH